MARPSARGRCAASPGRAGALALFLVFLACAGAAPSAAMTALTIDPPEGFTVRLSTPEEADDTGYEVSAASDPDVGCQVNLTDTRHPRDHFQSALNREAAEPGYLDRVRAGLAGLFDVRDVAPFSTRGADGSVATADPKVAGGAARAAIFDVETTRGNLEVLCVSSTDEFDAWRPLFERVARGVDLPR